MEAIFLKLLNMSITASYLVLAILLLRFVLKKAPKAFISALWTLVAVRLVCPFSIESIFSLIPSTETVPESIIYAEKPTIHSGIPFLNSTVNPIISESLAPNAGDSVNPVQIIVFIASVLWIAGMAAMFIYAALSFLRIHKAVREAALWKENIWLCDRVETPFILGLFRPRIYLPSAMGDEDKEYVIAHEKAHLKRCDHLWKPFAFLLLTVYWFNPILWIAYILFCRDIEFACDEKVIQLMGSEYKKAYSSALINCSIPRRAISACPLAFGEIGVKRRIQSVLSYKKPAFWIIVLAVILSFTAAICFLTDPIKEPVFDTLADKGYQVTAQKQTDITLSVPKDALPNSIYTEEGHTFEENEVIVYEDGSTRIYLERVQPANEGNEQLYFIFNFSYSDFWEGSNTVLSPYFVTEQGYSAGVGLRSKNLRDDLGVYENAVSLRAQGPYEQFAFYVTTQVCRDAVGTINMDAFCYELTYDNKPSELRSGETITWTYTPSLSATFHYALDFHFDFDYTHVKTTCSNGKMWNLSAEGQPKDTSMDFAFGEAVCWTPDTVNGKGIKSSEIRFTAYDGSKMLYSGSIKIKRVSSGDFSSIYEVYLTDSGGLRLFSDGSLRPMEAPDIAKLQEKYPQYFGLNTDDGLAVYIWQLAEGSYSCVLLSKNHDLTPNEICFLNPTSIIEMRAILSSYNLSEDEISVNAITNPISSYWYVINEDYTAQLRERFWAD